MGEGTKKCIPTSEDRIMSTVNGTKYEGMEAAAAVPTLQQIDAKIAGARRAQSETIKRMVVG